jgi:hypothetical protein
MTSLWLCARAHGYVVESPDLELAIEARCIRSFGVVMWEMITLKHPWRDVQPQTATSDTLSPPSSVSETPASSNGIPRENSLYENRVPEYESSLQSLQVNTFAIMSRVTSGERYTPHPPAPPLLYPQSLWNRVLSHQRRPSPPPPLPHTHTPSHFFGQYASSNQKEWIISLFPPPCPYQAHCCL